MRLPKHRQRMSVNNPMKNSEIAKKVSRKLKGKKRPNQIGPLNNSSKPEVIEKIRKKLKNRDSYWMKGDNNWMKTAEHRQRMAVDNPMYNPNSIKKLKESKTGIKHKLKTCPHCNKEGGFANMTRYHFDNCKLKGKISVQITIK